MRRIGVFVDVANLYYCIGKKFGEGKKLNYEAYYKYIADIGDVQQAVAYGEQQHEEEAKDFIEVLKRIGYSTKFHTMKDHRRWNPYVSMAIDIINMLGAMDILVLGSSNPDIIPIIEEAKRRGVSVFVLSCGINKGIKNASDRWVEIPESLLEIRTQKLVDEQDVQPSVVAS